jgi:hypothetical protein
VEVESTVEWKVNATKGEINMGDQDYIPLNLYEENKMHKQRRMHEISEPIHQLYN